MPNPILSDHMRDMLKERNILEAWVWRTIDTPDRKKRRVDYDDNMHYFKSIKERDGRVLHVVINPNVQPNRIVTIFFDRRARKKK